MCDRTGAIYTNRKKGMNAYKKDIAQVTNKKNMRGTLADVIAGERYFYRIVSSRCCNERYGAAYGPKIRLFLAWLILCQRYGQQMRKRLVLQLRLMGVRLIMRLLSPGLIRGTLEARASRITMEMKIAAATTIARLARKRDVVPDFMDLHVHASVAKAVAASVKK